jgi:hypothetical protein
VDKKWFDEIILPILSLWLCYIGLRLTFGPHEYQTFAATIDQPISRALARAPIPVIRSLGILILAGGLLLFYVFITKWP